MPKLTQAQLYTLIGSLLAIAIGVTDRWAFKGSFGDSLDVGLLAVGVGGLLGNVPTAIAGAMTSMNSGKSVGS